MGKYRLRARDVIVVIGIAFLIFIMGWFTGSYSAIKLMVSIGSNFVEIDYNMVSDAIYSYNNNLNTWVDLRNDEVLQDPLT